MKRNVAWGFAVLTLVCQMGCQTGSPVEEAVDDRPRIEFSGNPDPRVAGAYKTKDGVMTYDFREDGTYRTKGRVTTTGGVFDRETTGEWRIDGSRFLMRDANGNVTAYDFNRKPKELKLTQHGSMKRETVLIRQ